MDTALLTTGLASAVFVLSHVGLSSDPVRSRIVGRIGENPFRGLYSLVALLALGAMIAAYANASGQVYLWPPGPGVRHLPLLIMPISLILIAGGMTTPNPSAVGMEDNLDRSDLVKGVLRITRHPMMWGIVLWAAVHILANGDLASMLFFGGLLLTAGVGSFHLDRRMASSQGERWQRFAATTSYIPFAAILTGRQSLVFAELRRAVLLGLGIFVVLLLLHPYLFGVRPY